MKRKKIIIPLVLAAVLALAGLLSLLTHQPANPTRPAQAPPSAKTRLSEPSSATAQTKTAWKREATSQGTQNSNKPIADNMASSTIPFPAYINSASPVALSASKSATGTSSSSGKRPDYLGGQVATANISAEGKTYRLQPNQGGDFGQIIVEPNAKASIQVVYPQAEPNDVVTVATEDGGALDAGRTVETVQLDSSRRVAFEFKSGTQQGIYRVTLQQGSDLKQIDFWVGPEPQLAVEK